MESKYDQFIRLNKELLDCYSSVHPNNYIVMDPATQKDVCFSERMKLENMLTKGKIGASDFFDAYKVQKE